MTDPVTGNVPFDYPRKIVSGAALFLDEAGRLLVVNPTYKPSWEIPGGLAEVGEAPAVAARREIAEELGIDRAPGALLCVEWRPPMPTGNAAGLDGLHFIFAGGVLDASEVAAITLPADELSEFALFPPEQAMALLPARLAARVRAALSVWPHGPTLYMEAGVEHGAPARLRDGA